jgi:transketolase N-terminal domain/subunit
MHGTDRLLVADDSELAAAATRRFRPGGSVADGVALACAARAREPGARVFVVAGVEELAGAITLALAARAVRARLGNLVVLCDDHAEDLALHLGVSGWHVASAGARDRARLVAVLRRAMAQHRPSFVTVAGITPAEVAAALRAVAGDPS